MGNETIGMMFLVLKDIAWLATTVKDDMTTGKLLVEQMVLKGKIKHAVFNAIENQDMIVVVGTSYYSDQRCGRMMIHTPHTQGKWTYAKLKSNDSQQDLLLLVVVVGIMVVVQPHKHGR